MTYKGCKMKIEKNMYSTQEEMQTMLDVFYMGERINQAEYKRINYFTEKQTYSYLMQIRFKVCNIMED